MKLIDADAFKQKYLCCGFLPEMSEEEFDTFPEYTPPNQPLTLEELKEVDGEPVWVCGLDGKHGKWMIANSDYCTIHTDVALYSDFGIKWIAYRRKPEDLTDAQMET